MSKNDGLNKLIVKAIGLFGGAQVMSILCSVIRTKLVSLWIGPLGVGLFGLWNTALELLNNITNLGINSSSVRDMSQAAERRDSSHIAQVVAVVRRWSLWLAAGGAILTILLSPALSVVSFGSTGRWIGFVALAAAVMMTTIANGEKAVLQGTGGLKRLAKASVVSTILGVALCAPLFYFFREASVLPSVILCAAILMVVFGIMRRRDIAPVKIAAREAFRQGREFVVLGVFMTVGGIFALVSSYLFNAWLNHASGTEEVGYYQAGYTLVTKYAGLVLSALAVEYFPRLAKVTSSALRTRVFVSQEINISLWILAPVLALMILLREPIVCLLYTGEFALHILPFVTWMLIGTLLRAFSWAMSFEMLARGDGKIFVVTEFASEAIGFALNVWFYSLWGLEGLGLSFTLWYAIYCVIVGLVYHLRYRLTISAQAWRNLFVTFLLVGALALAMQQSLALAIAVAVAVLIASALALYRIFNPNRS